MKFPLRAAVLSSLLAWLAPRAIRAEDAVRYKYQDYRESGGRIAVEVNSVGVEKDIGTDMHLKVEGVLDAITGATPNGQPAPAGSTQVPLSKLTDRRKAWNAAFSRQFARVNVAPTGLAAPASPLRSGGPGSAVAFDCLGAEGQQFVTSGPSAARISAYSGAPGVEPIRVYAGLDCAATPQARAALAVDELRRTGAFDRDLIVVAMTTGNGYLDPALVDAPELLTGGDIATVSSQYSVLPSWLSLRPNPGTGDWSCRRCK